MVEVVITFSQVWLIRIMKPRAFRNVTINFSKGNKHLICLSRYGTSWIILQIIWKTGGACMIFKQDCICTYISFLKTCTEKLRKLPCQSWRRPETCRTELKKILVKLDHKSTEYKSSAVSRESEIDVGLLLIEDVIARPPDIVSAKRVTYDSAETTLQKNNII